MKNHFKILVKTFILSLITMSLAQAYSIESIEFLTEEYPPYNFTNDDGELVGIAVDILEETLKQLGSQKTRKDFIVLPWARGYADVRSPSARNALFSTTRTPLRESLFKWAGPISETVVSVFADSGKNYQINNSNDLKSYKFSAIRGDIGGLLLGGAGVKAMNILNSANFDTMVRQVTFGRTQMFAYEQNVAFWLMNKHNLKKPDYQPIYTLQTGSLYYAFNSVIEDETVERFQQALNIVLADKALVDSIRQKYLN